MGSAGRVVMVSADAGVGHDTAVAELTRRLRGRGFVVDRVDVLEVLPRAARWGCTKAYRRILRWLPWGHRLLSALGNRSRLSVSLLRALLRPVRHRMRRAIPVDTRAVVTTCPSANQILGPLRRQGRLAVPLISYVIDSAVDPRWLAPGVDLYCAARHAEVRPGGAPDAVQVIRADLAGPGADPAGVVADAATRAGSAGTGERGRQPFIDSVGDAAAVVAALLQAAGGAR